MDWVTDLKVYGSQLAAVAITLLDVQAIFTIILASASIIYTVYKILELEAKRRYYLRRRKEKEEKENE